MSSATVLETIGARLGAHALTADEARAVWAEPDLVSVGALADEIRRRRHGDRTTFVRVADVPFEHWETAALPGGAGEIRLTGVPTEVDALLAAVRGVIARAGGVPVTGFSMGDLSRLAGSADALGDVARRLSVEGLAAVAYAAVDSVPDLRRMTGTVLGAGLPVARFTVERLAGTDPVSLLCEVRGLQKQTGAVHVFAPLPRAIDPTRPTTGYDDVKLVALARLVLDNVSSIQVDWALYGPKLAQVALLFGADDIDAVSAVDDVSEGRRRAPLEEIRRNVLAASLAPVERDGRFGVRE